MRQALTELQAVGRALDQIDVGTCVFDDAGRLLVWNAAFLKLFPVQPSGDLAAGETFSAILQRFHGERIAKADLLALEQYVRDGMAGCEDGGPLSFSLEGRQIEVAAIDAGAAGRISVWRCPAQAEEPADGMRANYRLLAEFSSDVIVLVEDGRIEQVAPSVERLLGRAPAALVGKACSELLAPEYVTMLDAALQLETRQPFQARAQHADGGTRWVEITLAQSPHLPRSVVLTLRDIGARKEAELQLQQASRELEAMALTDALTGAANRRSFDIGLDAEWRRTQRDQRPLALLLFDADHFKRLNDRHGHPAGDEVLKRLAAQLRSHARRPGDLHARYGGEEFALVLPATGAEAAMAIGNAVRRAFAECFGDRPELATTVSVGVAVAPEDADSPAELLQHADVALYRAKAQGRDRCVRWARDAG